MGLLDDAIREHLELKRMRGADPGEIAKVERDALEPVIPDEPSTWGEEPVAPLTDGADPDPVAATPPADADADAGVDPLPATAVDAADFANIGQETAELDMEAVLKEDAAAHPGGMGSEDGAAAVRAQPSDDGAGDVDSFEWEVPSDRAEEPPPEPIPGQERLTFE